MYASFLSRPLFLFQPKREEEREIMNCIYYLQCTLRSIYIAMCCYNEHYHLLFNVILLYFQCLKGKCHEFWVFFLLA